MLSRYNAESIRGYYLDTAIEVKGRSIRRFMRKHRFGVAYHIRCVNFQFSRVERITKLSDIVIRQEKLLHVLVTLS